jgi:hypothetical protein
LPAQKALRHTEAISKQYRNPEAIEKIPFPIGKNLLNINSIASVRSIGFLSKVPGAGFEPAKLYAEDLESTPFDRSGTPASCWAWDNLFLTIPLELTQLNLSDGVVEGYCGQGLNELARQ